MARLEEKEEGTPLPTTPAPPRFDGEALAGEAGRRIRALAVDPGPGGKAAARPPAPGESRDLEAAGREPAKEGRGIRGDPAAILSASSGEAAPALPPSEMERRFERYSKLLEKLDVDERRAVEEFRRRLRDIR